MLRSPLFASGLSIVALTAAVPAFAQVSAPDLWAEWQAQSALTQQPITAASQSYENGVLTLNGIVTESDQDGVTSVATLEQITIAEQADGTALITASSPYAIRVETATPFAATQVFEFNLAHEGLQVVASGQAGNRTFVYSADRLMMTEGLMTDEFGEPIDVDIDLTMAGLQATYNVVGTAAADDLAFTSNGTTDSLSGQVSGVDGPSTFNFSINMTDIVANSNGDLSGLVMMGASNALPEGMSLAGAAEYGALDVTFGFQEPGETLNARTRNQGGAIEFGIVDTILSYALRGTAPVVAVETSELPFPLNVSADSTEVDLAMPMRPGDGSAQEADILISYQNVVIGDQVWAMFDPGQAIPRSPATIVLDLTAQLIVLQDLLNPEAAGFGPPFDPRAVTLNNLQVAFGGAELTGSGAVTMPGGLMDPTPQGQVSLRLTGGNGLMQGLMAAGLLPQEQAMMTQMMLGMFAIPGDGPDTLISDIEFLPDGTILSNGTPLPF